MRRLFIPLLLLAALIPGRASAAVNGSVMVPTFGTPALARYTWAVDSSRTQGILGFVFSISARNVQYTLQRTGGMTGMEDFDLFFYQSLDGLTGTTAGAAQCTTTNPVCRGTVPPNANFAIVTLSVGAAGTFVYSNP